MRVIRDLTNLDASLPVECSIFLPTAPHDVTDMTGEIYAGISILACFFSVAKYASVSIRLKTDLNLPRYCIFMP